MRLADGTTLIHIGPFKTGTTAMQGALWAARDEIASHGVLYPGARAHEMAATMAVARGNPGPGHDLAAMRARWHRMVRELHERQPRIGVLSSEVYCEATDDGVREVLDAVGPDVHVLITLRPIVRLLASQWQQYAQNVPVPPYDAWLRAILDEPDGGTVTPTFWRRHRHDRLVERWVGLVGPERVSVVVVDDRDHEGLPRTFEQLLGLPTGLLQVPADRANRSLTFAETELVQTLVRRTAGPDRSLADHDRFVRFGAARGLQAAPPDPAAERVLTPEWAVERGLEIGAMMAAGVAASGARVIGDLGLLSDPALAPATGTNAEVDAIAPESAAALVGGLVAKLSGVLGKAEPRAGGGPVERAVWSRHRAVVERWDAAAAAQAPRPTPASGPSGSPASPGGWRALAGRARQRLRRG